jgi:rhomboid protease GluP
MRNRADPLTHAVRTHYGQWLIIGIVLSLVPGIDIAAHIGGFIGGFVVGFLAGLPGLPNTPKETLWRVLAGVALAATVYAFLQDARSYHALVRSI